MKTGTLILSAALFLGPANLVTAIAAQQTTTPAAGAQAVPTAEQFAQMAAVSNMFEIQSSMMAKTMAQSPEVKSFAEQMIADHTKAGQDLKNVANASVPDTLDNPHQLLVEQLGKLQGADFDKQYVQMQVQAHQEAVNLFSSYAQSGDSGDLKNFAAQTLPVLQQHYDHIQQIAKK